MQRRVGKSYIYLSIVGASAALQLDINCCVLLGVALLVASCAAPARAALPTPAPGVHGTALPYRERAGQLLRAAANSAVYGSSIAISVYIPPCYASGSDRLPVIYLLHGGDADETQSPGLRVAQAADDLNVFAVLSQRSARANVFFEQRVL